MILKLSSQNGDLKFVRTSNVGELIDNSSMRNDEVFLCKKSSYPSI